MKKLKKKLYLFALCMMIMPMSVYAQESKVETQNSARSSVPEIVSVKDGSGNVYGVMASSYKSGKKATVSTYWDVSYVWDGKESTEKEILKYSKYVKSFGQVAMVGGATNSFGNYQKSFVNVNSGTHTTSDSYLYTVSSLTGTHTFSCNGAKLTYVTSD